MNTIEQTTPVLTDETLGTILHYSTAVLGTFPLEKLAEVFQVNPKTIGRPPNPETIKTLSHQLYKRGQLKRLIVAAAKANQVSAEMIENLLSLGGVLFHAGYTEWSYHLFRRALQIGQKLWGNEHIEVAYIMSNVSGVLYRLQKAEEAIKMGQEAVQIASRTAPDLDKRKALIQHNLASMLYSQQRFQEAYDLYLEAYDGRIKLLGYSHPETIDTMKNIGTLLVYVNQIGQGLRYLEKAFLAQNYLFGLAHPHTTETLNELIHIFNETIKATNDQSLTARAQPYQAAFASLMRNR